MISVTGAHSCGALHTSYVFSHNVLVSQSSGRKRFLSKVSHGSRRPLGGWCHWTVRLPTHSPPTVLNDLSFVIHQRDPFVLLCWNTGRSGNVSPLMVPLKPAWPCSQDPGSSDRIRGMSIRLKAPGSRAVTTLAGSHAPFLNFYSVVHLPALTAA